MTKTVAEQLMEQGEARGRVKEKAESVLTVLRKKFKKVPKDIEKAVLAKSDPIELNTLLEHAAVSVSLGEFATALQ